MSRIDISIKHNKTGEYLANTGFCRSSHLETYCEYASDEKVDLFAQDLMIGIDLNKETIDDFRKLLSHVLAYLEAGKNAKEPEPKFTKNPDTLERFIADLKESAAFLSELEKNFDIDAIAISIA